MANDDYIAARGGLLPLNFSPGGGTFRRTLYRLTTSATAAVYIGQPMDLDANGRVVPAGIADNSPVLGPVVGFMDTNKSGLPSNLTSLSQEGYLDGNVDAYCVIADDPNQIFVIQEDTGGTALAEGDIGDTIDMVPRTSSGSSVTGKSTFEADASTVAGDTGGQLRVLGLADYMNNDGTSNAWGDYAKLMVKINHHRLGGQPGVVL